MEATIATENKTQPTSESVSVFLNKIQDQQVRKDCFAILEMMQQVSQAQPVMWESAIIGFGSHHYVYESGREGDMMILGFSPRKEAISIYLMGGLNQLQDELSQLGKFKTGKGCLYIKSFRDVNAEALRKIFAKAFQGAQERKADSG